jgi:hypothetical protein
MTVETELSSAAQAVLDAYHMRADHEGPKCPEVCFIAEALLALEEQLAQDKPAPMSSDLGVAVLTERIRMLRKISAIAAELEAYPFANTKGDHS